MTSLWFILFSFGIGLLCVYFLRQLDKYEPEPFGRLFAVVVWGGLWANFICLFLYGIVQDAGVTELENSWGALLVIGPVEEISKFLALLTSFFIFKKEMDEPLDGLLYMSCVALGFSLIENYYYAAAFFPVRQYLFFTRLVICTPVHIAFSAFMGLAFYVWVNNTKAWGILLYAFVYAALVHGIYDLVIFNHWTVFVLAVVIWNTIKATLAGLRYATAISPFRKTLGALLSNQNPPLQTGMVCLQCGDDKPKQTYALGAVPIQKCAGCGWFVTPPKGIYAIFRHYAVSFERLKPHLQAIPDTSPRQYQLYQGNRMTHRMACFDLPRLNETLEKLNKDIIHRMEARWWFPEYLFRGRGRKVALNSRKLAWRGVRHLRRRLVYPFASLRRKSIFLPDTRSPGWSWGAFLVPELWYPGHAILGVFLFLILIYSAGAWWIFSSGINPWSGPVLGCFVFVRLLCGRLGPVFHYYRHGRWP
jgi:RsiW-degrading membrane proteinase PrsW (M82 family)